MTTHKSFFLFLVSAASLIFTRYPVRAATDCVTEPKPLPSTHWYYHIDPLTQQKCWYAEVLRAPPPSSPKSEGSIAKKVRPAANRNARDAALEIKTVSTASSKRETTNATLVAECEVQALKVYDEEKTLFLKQCLSTDTK